MAGKFHRCATCGKAVQGQAHRRWTPQLRRLWMVLFGEESLPVDRNRDDKRDYNYICGPCRSRLSNRQARGREALCREYSAFLASQPVVSSPPSSAASSTALQSTVSSSSGAVASSSLSPLPPAAGASWLAPATSSSSCSSSSSSPSSSSAPAPQADSDAAVDGLCYPVPFEPDTHLTCQSEEDETEPSDDSEEQHVEAVDAADERGRRARVTFKRLHRASASGGGGGGGQRARAFALPRRQPAHLADRSPLCATPPCLSQPQPNPPPEPRRSGRSAQPPRRLVDEQQPPQSRRRCHRDKPWEAAISQQGSRVCVECFTVFPGSPSDTTTPIPLPLPHPGVFPTPQKLPKRLGDQSVLMCLCNNGYCQRAQQVGGGGNSAQRHAGTLSSRSHSR